VRTAGVIIAFLGYTISSYGLVLLRDWDIPFRQWVNPLNGYQYPAKGTAIPTIPLGQLFPSSATAASGNSASNNTTSGLPPVNLAPTFNPKTKPLSGAGLKQAIENALKEMFESGFR
jgi:hypothetical protein